MRTTRNENAGWRFTQGDPEGACRRRYDDADWRRVDLPHDFMIEADYDRHTPAGTNTGFLPGGVGWYRKTLELPSDWQGRRVHIDFDGVMSNARVFVNGDEAYHRPNGYVGFRVDITDHLRFDGRDVVAVRADTSEQPASRWYTGSGIYRDVRLVVTDPIHVARNGICVQAETLDDERAILDVQVEVENAGERETDVNLDIVAEDGDLIRAEASRAAVVKSQEATATRCTLTVENPRRWSPEAPHLYRMVVTVRRNGQALDQDAVSFGLRTAEFDPDRGFLLNAEPTKLKGVCLHHDLGPLGAKCFRDAIARRLRLLKRAGCNAVRCSHNPFSPDFYDLCDRLGLLVIDELFDEWRQGKRPFTYHRFFDEWWERDLTEQLRAHRNHPCIIMWSVGNEIPEKGSAEGVETLKMLRDACHRLDPARPVTAGCNGIDGANASGFAEELDVVGINGGGGGCFRYDENHERYPHRKLYASEVPHTFATRGIYRTRTRYRDEELHPERFARMEHVEVPDLTREEVFTDVHPRYASSYDNALVRINVRDSWRLIAERNFMAGEFRWTGIDYLGESHAWPAKHSNAGVIDLCGFPKDPYHLYRAFWTREPMVHLLPHWTHPGKEGAIIPVFAYTNCEEAELFLSGESLGRKPVRDCCVRWDVPYRPGKLRVEAHRRGWVAAEAAARTACEPARIALKADRQEMPADRMSLLHVEARVVDASGTLAPHADNRITFAVEGPGEVIAVGNGDPISDEAAVASARRAFNGMALCIVRGTGAPGRIIVTAQADGLHAGTAKSLVTTAPPAP
ncbi:MAG: glycoside hydrolase family 2 TIM barrel-domain containing protein [Candidatus Brocadiia bacterium]